MPLLWSPLPPATAPRLGAFRPHRRGRAASTWTLLALLLTLLVPQLAEAATRTIHGRIYFHNDRVQYSTGSGSRLTSTGTSGDDVASMSYVKYRVNARCGTTITQGAIKYAAKNGYFTQTFTNVCSAPQLRVQVWLESKPGDHVFHRVTEIDDGATRSAWIPSGGYMSTTASEYVDGKLRRSLSVSCRHSWDWHCDESNDSLFHRAANIYKTGVDVYEAWGYYKHEHYGPVKIEFPTAGDTSFGGTRTIEATADAWDMNHRIAHEFGHTYHRRGMDKVEGNLSKNTWCREHSWHSTPNVGSPTSPRYSETCATAEGWADFFAAATYFERTSSHAYYAYCGDRCDDGLAATCNCGAATLSTACRRQCRDGQRAQQMLDGPTWNRGWNPQMNGSNPALYSCVRHPSAGGTIPSHVVESNVARFFWDLYDTGDGVTADRTKLRMVWDLFPAGWGQGKRDEPNDGDVEAWDDRNGRNVRDYIGHWPTAAEKPTLQTILNANCLGGQATD